jgi:Fur family peroxide stress response transcriptional regulator
MSVSAEELERRVDRFLHACRRSGLRVTHQRVYVFQEVARSDQHPDAETIRRRLRGRLPNLSLDTVYRTLRLMEELGVASAVFADPERVRYDGNPEPHHHLVCTKCRQVRDFYLEDAGEFRLPRELKPWGRVTSSHLEVRGICSRCGGKAARKRRGVR